MDSLKFLGKPAPKISRNGFIGEYANREHHLEGAIKEAAELMEGLDKLSWRKGIARYGMEFAKEFLNFEGTEKQFIAFLLRKTIGEK